MCATAKALPSAGCTLPRAEGLAPSGAPGAHHPSRPVPRRLTAAHCRSQALTAPRACLASCSARQETTSAATFEILRRDRPLAARRPSRAAPLPSPSRSLWRARTRSEVKRRRRVEPRWSPGFGSPRPFEGRSHTELGGWILDAFITSYFRPGCWTHAGEPSSLEATEEIDEWRVRSKPELEN